MIDIVIFTKNRPLQLYSLLESLDKNTDFRDSSRASVIYKYENQYLAEIPEIQEKFPFIRFVKQEDFKSDVLSCIDGRNKFCTFFVDDIVVKSKTSFSDICNILSLNSPILTLSLRMGLQLNFCYPTRSPQQIPNGIVQNGLFAWDWRSGEGDWGYPFSVDGHVFRKSEIMRCITEAQFSNPNQFEDRMQSLKMMNLPTNCACFVSSKIVNLPLNRVQNEYKNRSEEETPESLLEIWKSGKKIKISSISEINNISAHFPAKISLEDRS